LNIHHGLKKCAFHVQPCATYTVYRVIQDVMQKEAPVFWESLPIYVQQELVVEAMSGAPEVGAVSKLNPVVVTHSLKPPGFNP
jgi:hypothetical protein